MGDDEPVRGRVGHVQRQPHHLTPLTLAAVDFGRSIPVDSPFVKFGVSIGLDQSNIYFSNSAVLIHNITNTWRESLGGVSAPAEAP